ncbi:MAG: MATE family efflux transporter [Tissierellia bacterium]|nr:MATE family efflux transporter [Tissierellia bacterium]
MKNFWNDRAFFKAMLSIALPITIQNLIASSVNMLDTLMITSLGQGSLAAVGLANQVFFFYGVTVFGISTGSAIFIAQFWGNRDKQNIKRVLGLSLTLSSLLGILFTLAALFIPEYLMKIFSKDPEVIAIGVKYLKTVSVSYIITGISFSYAVASRSVGEARMPVMASFVSLIINGVLNYLLIFGKFGFPRLGVAGAAYATLIARVAELLIILHFVYSSRGPLAANIREMTDWNENLIRRYFRTATPVIFNEVFWSLGTVLYSIAYAKIGTEAAAAVQILNVVQNIFMVITRGMGNACTVLVGNKIGAGEEDTAIQYANRFLILSIGVGLFLGAGIFLSSDLILKAFRNLTPELYDTSKKLLIVLAIFFTIKVYNGTMIVGVLRGGGDTRFSMILDMVGVWFIGVPLAFIGALVLKFPIYYVTPMVYMEEIVKAIMGTPRVISRKWVTNLIEDI